MFNLERFIPRDETILFLFGISLRYVVVSVTLWTLFLGGLALYFLELQEESFLAQVLLILLVIIIVLYIIRFLTTAYFLTENKIYKVTGLGFQRVTSAKKSEIDDMKVVQGFLERLLFNTGTIKFNTPGSAGFEIILPRVGDPYETKQNIYDVWDEPTP